MKFNEAEAEAEAKEDNSIEAIVHQGKSIA